MRYLTCLQTVMFLFIVIPIFSQENIASESRTYLENYFNTENYDVSDCIQVNDETAFLVLHYIDKSKEIVDRAILCSFTDGCIRNYIYINKGSIQDEYGNYLLSTKLNAYGWRVRIMDAEKIKFGFVFYSNNGANVTDGPRIIWNRYNKKFELFKVDTSQY